MGTGISSQGISDQLETGMVVKAVDLPRFNIDTKTLNAYNRKNINQNKINYEIIDIVKDYVKSNHTQHAKNVRNIYESALKSDHGVMMDNIKELKVVLENFFNGAFFEDLIEAAIRKNALAIWLFL